MSESRISGWLARLSDPGGLNRRSSPPAFDAGDEAQWLRLLDEAGSHNVRPAVVRNLGVELRESPGSFIRGTDAETAGPIRALMASANDLRLQDVSRAVLLASVARQILQAIDRAGLPATLVKGVDFAEKAYGGLHMRSFSDIDLLVRPEAEADLGEVLRALGLEAHEPPGKRIDYTERQWTRSHQHGGLLLVEVHTDVVHAPELRARQTLTYDLYADPAAGGITPAGRMVLAGLHGATSHLFGRLQYVVDGLMIARMGVDADELRVRAERSGALLPVATMLRLAAELYGCGSSRGLLDALGPVAWARLERRLISAPMVMSAKSVHRWRLLPQRYLYRRLLRMTGLPS
ncbi:putative nucleotidyltransferase-like protein [Hoeflea marina]|uniref:Putative nucleotidyltransferase-like protein n=1 Tax=Hoeflea marina TaxID=274592 RepID=A0A317PHJ2_9HYPH|nr:nucleotidyltransferase family protein [Hoeflea marina]PWV99902.1 putative nucleotidyltransferase-like protein [Hoeflea marina]